MTLRGLAERLSRRVVLGRRLPSEFGSARLSVSPAAGGLRYWHRDLRRVDPALLRLARAVQAGATVWDVGANVGLFAYAAAFRAGPSGHVLALEPDVDNLRLLYRSQRSVAGHTGYARVDVLPLAATGPGSRLARLDIASRARASNALSGFGNSQMGPSLETRWVGAVALDELLESFPPPDLLKVDVEGAEVEVLKGSARILEGCRPVFFVEVGGERAGPVKSVLAQHRYVAFDGEAERPLHAAVESPPWSTIAVPVEKVGLVCAWFEPDGPRTQA